MLTNLINLYPIKWNNKFSGLTATLNAFIKKYFLSTLFKFSNKKQDIKEYYFKCNFLEDNNFLNSYVIYNKYNNK